MRFFKRLHDIEITGNLLPSAASASMASEAAKALFLSKGLKSQILQDADSRGSIQSWNHIFVVDGKGLL